MEINQNGTKYKNYVLWESTKQTPYDYERNGLVKRIVSKPIAETTNPILKFMLNFYESSMVFMFKAIDLLKHFKDIHWFNR